jgi:hypothetical protein
MELIIAIAIIAAGVIIWASIGREDNSEEIDKYW